MNEENKTGQETGSSVQSVSAEVAGMPSLAAQGIPVQTDVSLMGDKGSIVSIALLLSYIRYYLNTGNHGTISVKIGYNKPPSMPFNFTVNDELLDEIYPGDTIEIN